MLTYDRSVVFLAVATGVPGLVLALVLLYAGGYSVLVQVTAGTVVVALWAWMAVLLRSRIVRPLQTVSNLLSALREAEPA